MFWVRKRAHAHSANLSLFHQIGDEIVGDEIVSPPPYPETLAWIINGKAIKIMFSVISCRHRRSWHKNPMCKK